MSKNNEALRKAQPTKEELILRLQKLNEQDTAMNSYRVLARKIGVSASALSQWIKGTYRGNNKIVTEAVKIFFKHLDEKESLGITVKLNYVPITNNKKILALLATAHSDAIMAAVIGDTGTSKTVSILQYMKEHNVIYIHANRSYRWPVEYLRQIHRHPIVGKDGLGKQNDIMNDIIAALKGKPVLIIVDQADYLNLTAIDMFRTINDDAEIGIVFVGLPSFQGKLRGNEPEIKQVRDRIKRTLILKPFTQDDCKKILEVNWNGLNGLHSDFYKHSKRSARVLESLIYNCRRLIESPNTKYNEVTTECIQRASEML